MSSSNPPAANLQLIQYRSFRYTIQIFHYAAHSLPYGAFKSIISSGNYGHVSTTTTRDPMSHRDLQEGDEVPTGHLEALYLTKVYRGKGCALGFRLPGDAMEWLSFNQPIDGLLDGTAPLVGYQGVNEVSGSDKHHHNALLFEKVAELEKGGGVAEGKRNVQGCWEHRLWYEVLADGGRRAAGLAGRKKTNVERWRELREKLRLFEEAGLVEGEEENEEVEQ